MSFREWNDGDELLSGRGRKSEKQRGKYEAVYHKIK